MTLEKNKEPKPVQDPRNYIFITNDAGWDVMTPATQIVSALASKNYWLASDRTPYKKLYQRGDRVLFYVAGTKARYFKGCALISGPIAPATDQEKLAAEDLGLEGFEERIPLESVVLWEKTPLLKPLVEDLEFIKDKQNYGLHLRQAAAQISNSDYDLIVAAAKSNQ